MSRVLCLEPGCNETVEIPEEHVAVIEEYLPPQEREIEIVCPGGPRRIYVLKSCLRFCGPGGAPAASVSLQNARGWGEQGGGEEPAEDHEARRGPLAEPARGLPYLPLLQRTRRQQQ